MDRHDGGKFFFCLLPPKLLWGGNLGQVTMILLIVSYFAMFSMPIVNGWGLSFYQDSCKKRIAEEDNQALKSLLLVVAVLLHLGGIHPSCSATTVRKFI